MLGEGYGKIFKQIYAGTLRADWKALITFEQMIVLCDANGVMDMPPEVIHNITGIPLAIIEHGIKTLESPDPRSRSPEHEGRRIVRLDDHREWGWQIVNHEYYRDLATREEQREGARLRKQRQREREKPDTNQTGHGMSRDVTHGRACHGTQTQTQTQTHTQEQQIGGKPALPHGLKDTIYTLYRELLPDHPRLFKWTPKREGHLKARWREHPHVDQWRQFFLLVKRSAFLTGKTKGTQDRPPFVADLAWLICPENFAKVMEGKYDNGR